jgi:hypothetical protein
MSRMLPDCVLVSRTSRLGVDCAQVRRLQLGWGWVVSGGVGHLGHGDGARGLSPSKQKKIRGLKKQRASGPLNLTPCYMLCLIFGGTRKIYNANTQRAGGASTIACGGCIRLARHTLGARWDACALTLPGLGVTQASPLRQACLRARTPSGSNRTPLVSWLST